MYEKFSQGKQNLLNLILLSKIDEIIEINGSSHFIKIKSIKLRQTTQEEVRPLQRL